MDKETISSYNRDAESIAKIHSTLKPARIYELIGQYFIKNGITADIGCGIGRDTHWLSQQGFLAIGVDASEEMLKQATSLYPRERFIRDDLPDLKSLKSSDFQNILCSAVLMHLSPDDLKKACHRLLQLLKNEGCLLISFRGTNNPDRRENGKLYETINFQEFTDFFIQNGCSILLQESEVEAGRNLTWHNIVIKK